MGAGAGAPQDGRHVAHRPGKRVPAAGGAVSRTLNLQPCSDCRPPMSARRLSVGTVRDYGMCSRNPCARLRL